MKKISVIVPVYNVEKYLNDCIDSIIKQTYKNIEIILVDDGSTDNSASICDEYAKKDNRIKVIHKENGGLSSARNAGLDEATGDYIGFIDSDDTIDDHHFEILFNLIKKYNVKLSFCCLQKFGEGDNGELFKYPSKEQPIIDKIITVDESVKEVLLNDDIGHYVVTKLFHRDLFNNIKFPVGRTYEDVGMLYKVLAKVDEVAYTNQKTYNYLFKRKGSITENFNEKKIIDSLETHYDEYKFFYKKYPNIRKYLNVSFVKSYTSLMEKICLNQYDELYIRKDILEMYEEFKSAMDALDEEFLCEYLEPYRLISAIMLRYNREIYRKMCCIIYKNLKNV